MIKFVRIASFLIAAAITVISIFFINSEQELAQAKLAYKSDDMDQALRKARRANRAFSENDKKVQAYYLQARAASKMNWNRKSIDYLDKLLSLDKKNISGLLFRGELMFQEGENQNAILDLNKGIALAKGNISNKNLAYSLSKRGLAYLALDQINAAEVDAKEAVQLSANLPEVHDLMSRVFEEKGDIKKALEECELTYQLSLERDKRSFMTPEGQKLSDRLINLRVKNVQLK